MHYRDKKIQSLCKLGNENDTSVSIKISDQLKNALVTEGQLKGFSLSEEIYVRLCESIDLDSHKNYALHNDLPSFKDPDWLEFIFNKKIAVDKKARDKLNTDVPKNCE